jgi:hypothetical protein
VRQEDAGFPGRTNTIPPLVNDDFLFSSPGHPGKKALKLIPGPRNSKKVPLFSPNGAFFIILCRPGKTEGRNVKNKVGALAISIIYEPKAFSIGEFGINAQWHAIPLTSFCLILFS